ncbi:TIGR03617 family F420-dependent LLM class oxidoreductase [Mycobacterium sp. 852002-51057_SCH5723018]|uniref:TIGR03617 family F420-dependent LLM class oxidoreductase n=1 Tax=Mycobacterium sp. 852002-51057_SCH5723018 TaxID=1834094 RepID=UPI0007FC570C|nr:TIGR03617 family F420-dependent LLM class oxidoreductase [Mycobacterium sp. 852002-51057_SCH5723018]OBG30269.1 LLM class F420-dependent oxidoreductase [Mycobacterium sp. 852002-51057_SCH5723018]
MKVHLQGNGRPDKAAARAREIAEVGADGLFSFEGPNDVFLPLVAAAGVSDLELMTNIAVAGPRSPLHLAHAANDLQLYSQGRFRLGLGSQTPAHIVKRYSGQWGKPAARMAENVEAIKAIFAAWEGNAPLSFRGEFYTHTLMTPAFDPGPNPFGSPPVLLGALGPLMTRTAAQVADGLLIHPLTSNRFFTEKTLSSYTDGLARSGRVPDDCAIMAQAMIAMGRTEHDLASAVNGVAFQIGFYGSTPAYLPVLEQEGFADVHPALNVLSKQGKFAEMRALISDDMVRTFGIVGTPEECAEQIGTRFGGHASDVCCYFSSYTPDAADVADLVAALHRIPA